MASADAYTDQQTQEALQSARTYSDAANVQTLNAAKAYTDQALAGYASADALNQFESQVNAHFSEVDRRIDRIGATSAAWAGFSANASGNGSGANNVGVGFGSQGGEQAMAVGYRRSIGKHASVSIGGAFSNGERSVSAGAGFNW